MGLEIHVDITVGPDAFVGENFSLLYDPGQVAFGADADVEVGERVPFSFDERSNLLRDERISFGGPPTRRW
jgi:hypothetical protein